MDRIFIIILVVTALSWQCRTPASQEEHPEQAQNPELITLIHDYYVTMSARDWAAYRAFFVEKASLTTVWQMESDTAPQIMTNTIGEFLAQTKAGPDSQPIFEEKPLSVKVDLTGNLATAWVKYEAKFGSEGNLMEWKGYDLFSFIRHEGKWKIASLVYESIED